MTERDWIEKDFYAELGVSSDASADEIKKAYRKLARDLHPDKNPGDAKAEARFKAVGEAYSVLSDQDKRRQYDETRRLFRTGGGGLGGFGGPGGGFGTAGDFNLDDLLGRAAGGAGAGAGRGGGGLGDLFGGLFGGGRTGGTRASTQARRGADVESQIRLDFSDAVRGATVALRLTTQGRCETCGGTGARVGSTPRTCPTCAGVGLVTRNQGAFAFSEPCRDCRGTGRIIDDPCPDCGGEGVRPHTRTLNVRIPAGVTDGKKIRIKGQGEPGRGGAPAGDLFVLVHVNPDRRFGRSERNPDDLTLRVPVTYPELALGATLTVPTLDGKVTLKVPAGTASGRTFRVKGRGVRRADGSVGDLLVTVEVAVPPKLDEEAEAALRTYAESTKSFDPRAGLLP
ncbi:molecular chaperone DnaJ [Pseudonocardia acaciae]|uniref:molecular chaperone DnaJ n=1 Tax=Pseudonocardia acaciae TaxID=551276 RepID=UPI000490A3F1|nr:molecular chaperone DnaJ [Pseudonocardia acaciae]